VLVPLQPATCPPLFCFKESLLKLERGKPVLRIHMNGVSICNEEWRMELIHTGNRPLYINLPSHAHKMRNHFLHAALIKALT
jgi:hypothetical protein